ncbi:MAG: hypothetical protein QXO75_09250, partial [Nitrososphaerota archaeon]
VAKDSHETSLPVMKLFVRAISVEFPKKATSEPETVVENWKQVCDERGWHNGWGRHQASSRNQMDEFNKLSVEEKAISIVGDFRIRKEEGNSYIVYDRFSGGVFGVNSVAAELIERIKAGNPSSEDINTVLKMLRQYYDEL